MFGAQRFVVCDHRRLSRRVFRFLDFDDRFPTELETKISDGVVGAGIDTQPTVVAARELLTKRVLYMNPWNVVYAAGTTGRAAACNMR